MQNTKTEYSSSERTPVVLSEMEQLLPPLSGGQFPALENDILENGCYAPIIVNENIIIIDGQIVSVSVKNTACPTKCWCSRSLICRKPSSGHWTRRRGAAIWTSGSWARLR